jgi:hypothetical protein
LEKNNVDTKKNTKPAHTSIYTTSKRSMGYKTM